MEYSIINGSEVSAILSSYKIGSGWLIETPEGDYHIFPSTEEASKEVAEYWQDMAKNHPNELRCMVGDESLIAWALGQKGGPGEEKFTSLAAFIEAVASEPWYHFGGYDHQEYSVSLTPEHEALFGFACGVAYRHN